MHKFIQQLLSLQELEQALVATQKLLLSCESNEASLDRLIKQLREQQASTKESLRLQQKNYLAEELRLTTMEETLARQKIQQATVKKSEDYAKLEASNQQLAQAISDLQDQLLTTLEGIEFQSKHVKSVLENTDKKIVELTGQKEQIQKQRLELEQQEQKQKEAMLSFEVQLQGAFYDAYLNLRKTGKAIPRVVAITAERKCSGCYLTLSNDLVANVATSSGPQFCEHCGRILYKKNYEHV